MKQFITIAIAMSLIYVLVVNEFITALKIIGFGSIAAIALYAICLVAYCVKNWNKIEGKEPAKSLSIDILEN